MSESVIDAIRRVDPCPAELPPPPIEIVRRRLREGPHVADLPTARRRPSVGAFAVVLSGAAATAVAVLAFVLLGHGHRAPPAAAGNGQAVGGQAGGVLPCRSEVVDGVLPTWARAGFTDPRPRMPYVLGDSGRIAAVLWGTLNSPPAADHTNKILWFSHVRLAPGSDLRIQAQRMNGTTRLGSPVTRSVTGGPGPSIINLPAPGCWRLTLHWSGWTDHLDLQYRHPA